MLNEEKKTNLSIKFKKHFPKKKKISQNEISDFLKEQKINYKKLGYSKLKNFLKDIPMLKIAEENNNIKIEIISDQKKMKNLKSINEENNKIKKTRNNNISKTNSQEIININRKSISAKNQTKQNKAPKILDEKIFIPKNIFQCLQIFSISEYNESFFQKMILTAIQNSIQNNPTVLDYIISPLPIKNYNGETLYVGVKKSSVKNYKYFVYYVGTTPKKPGDVLMSLVHFDDYDKCMNELANLCIKEPWCFKDSKDPYLILKIYFQYTFYSIKHQNKLFVDKKHQIAIFNTGLMDVNLDDIYCILKIKNQEFHFFGFSTAGSDSMGKMIVCLFPDLPEKASYIEKNSSSFLLDTDLSLHIDYQHILIDNLNRFPLDFIETIFSSFEELSDLILQIKAETNTYKRNYIYQNLKKKICQNNIAFSLLKSYFDGAVKNAWKIASHDYRYVIPSYFSTNNTLSLMLPIILDENKGPQILLLLEKVSSKSYQGQTILDLKQCYVNARLIGPTDYTFLKANLIED